MGTVDHLNICQKDQSVSKIIDQVTYYNSTKCQKVE